MKRLKADPNIQGQPERPRIFPRWFQVSLRFLRRNKVSTGSANNKNSCSLRRDASCQGLGCVGHMVVPPAQRAFQEPFPSTQQRHTPNTTSQKDRRKDGAPYLSVCPSIRRPAQSTLTAVFVSTAWGV